MLSESILEHAQAFRAGRYSPLEVVEDCLSRIEALDDKIHAWVLVDAEDAREAAARAAAELAAGQDRGPLSGIPVGIKDIVDVAGWPTEAGSTLRRGHMAQRDATVVARLREAGAVILGKTVTTEFACFDPPPTRNPWNLRHTPGGSSSGSAAAVALGMCLTAIGSQTGGSINRPASYCGICGLKPTFGRVSVAGVVPVSFHLDHIGPLGGRVSDLAAVLQAIAGHDERDPLSQDRPVDEYLRDVGRSLAPRLGLVGEFLDQADATIRDETLAAIERLRDGGATVETINMPESMRRVGSLHRRIMAVEAAEVHRGTFATHRSAYGPRIASLIDEGLCTTAVDYAEALRWQRPMRRDVVEAMAHFDALLAPATPTTAPADLSTTGDPRLNSPLSYLGLPTVSFPCSLAADGMPCALQLIGRPLEERPLLAMAAWCESQLGFDALPPGLGG